MVNFPEDFVNIFTLEPLCLQNALVNGSNWSLAGRKKDHVRSVLPWAFFLCEHTDECYFTFGFSSPFHCLDGGHKQCNAEEGDVRNSCFMGLLIWQYVNEKKKKVHHLILKNKHVHKFFKEGGCPTDWEHQVVAHEEAVVIA